MFARELLELIDEAREHIDDDHILVVTVDGKRVEFDLLTVAVGDAEEYALFIDLERAK